MDFIKSKDLMYWVLAGGLLWWILRKQGPSSRVSWDVLDARAADSLPDRTEEAQSLAPSMSKVIVNAPLEGVRDIADSTVDFIKRLEGLSLAPYQDASGYSVGYGHYVGAQPGPAITQAQADGYLRADLMKARNIILSAVKVPLSRNQFDALASFVYNTGEGNFRRSTLLKKLNAGDYTNAAQEFRRWIYSQGNILIGLVNRRRAERELFEKG